MAEKKKDALNFYQSIPGVKAAIAYVETGLRRLGMGPKIEYFGKLPPELFETVIDNIDDITSFKNLNLANKSYHRVLGQMVKETTNRKYTTDAAHAMYGSIIEGGIPILSWQDTPGDMGFTEAQPYTAIARQVGRAMGPIIRHMDDKRQGDFASRVIAAGPHIREEIVDSMANHMKDFKPKLKEEIYDAVVHDFINQYYKFDSAHTILEAALRNNLTVGQLNRVSHARIMDFDAQGSYDLMLRFEDDRIERVRDFLTEMSFSHLTERSARSGIEMTSDAMKCSDPEVRLEKFAEASKVLFSDAQTARGDLIAAQETRRRQQRGR